MRKGVILERNLTKYQCVTINKDGIVINTMGTGNSKEGRERISYGSYNATIFIGNIYIGHARNITVWGPLRLSQLVYMNVVIEISEAKLTFFGDKED